MSVSLSIANNDGSVMKKESVCYYLCPLLCVCVNVNASVLCVNNHACLF